MNMKGIMSAAKSIATAGAIGWIPVSLALEIWSPQRTFPQGAGSAVEVVAGCLNPSSSSAIRAELRFTDVNLTLEVAAASTGATRFASLGEEA